MPEQTPNPPRPRVLVTRAPEQSSGLADHLRSLGIDPILIPAIELAAPTSWTILDTALEQLNTFHWLLFTSANAAEAFANRKSRVPHPKAKPQTKSPRIAAIGPATARALQGGGLTPDLIPSQAIAESLTSALLSHTRQPDGEPTRFLLVRAEEARELLPETLRSHGAEVTIAPAYRTVIPASSVHLLQQLFRTQTGSPAAITFTSSSTARNLLALCEAAGVTFPKDTLRISIGPITTRTLGELGFPPHAEASEATVAALAEATSEAIGHE